jgi:photosystem II stability/assembly factor-like uncharacterized protein
VLVVVALAGALISIALPTGSASAHVPHDRIADVDASPAFATDGTVFTISRNHLMRSHDGGATWDQIVNGITGRPSRMAIAPTDAQSVYMALEDDGVFRSRDQGSSWVRTNSTQTMKNARDIAVSPRSAEVAFVTGRSGGLYRTTDGGGSWWSNIGSFGSLTALTVASNGRVLVGGGSGKVFISDDDGATWTEATGVPSGVAVTALGTSGNAAFAGTRGGKTFRSTTRGTSFAAIGTGLPAQEITSIALSPAYATDKTLWLSNWDAGVYRSTNRGTSFVKTSRALSTNPQAPQYGRPQVQDVIAPAGPVGGPPVLFASGYDGLFRSDDKAANWRQIQTLADHIVGLAVSPDYASDGTVVATTYVKGAYVSTDRGTTFEGRHTGLGFTKGQNSFAPVYRLTNVRFSPNYAVDGTIFTAGFTSVLKSTDRGGSWQALEVVPPARTQQLFAVAVSPQYATDRTVFVGSTFGTIHRSTNGGAAPWTQMKSVTGKVQSLLTSPNFATDKVLFAATESGVFKSANAGAGWTKASTIPSKPSTLAMSPDFQVDGTVYAAVGSEVYVTVDRGATWNRLANAPSSGTSLIEAVAVSPTFALDRMLLVSVTGKGLYRSDDAGVSFTPTGGSLLDQNLMVTDFDNPTAAPIQFSPAYALDRTIFAMAETRIVRSTDGGDTWEALDLPPATEFHAPPALAASATATANGDSARVRVTFDLSHPYPTDVTVAWRAVHLPHGASVASAAFGQAAAASGRIVYPAGTTRRYVDVATGPGGHQPVVIAWATPSRARGGAPVDVEAVDHHHDG